MKTGARTSKRVLKIVSKCSNEAEFIAVFQRFCTGDSLFVVTKTPKPVGSESRLAITLSTGKPMIVGDGKVTQSYDDGKDNPFGRPGMKIRLVGLDGDSATMMNKLNAARTAFELKRAAGKDGASKDDAPTGKNGSNGVGRKTMMGTAPAPTPRPQMKIPEIPVKKPVGPLERPKVKPEATPPPTLTPAKSDTATSPAAIGKLRERLPDRPPDASSPPAKTGKPAAAPATAKPDAPATAKPDAPAAAKAAAPKPEPASSSAIPERVDSSDSTVPVPVGKPKPKLAAIPLQDPDSDGDGFGDEDEVTQVSPEEVARLATGDSPTGESRIEGSELILPANPFGELTEQSLEAFVECTIYEESRPATVDGEGDEEMPAWWPESGGDGSTTPLPPAAPGMLPAGEMTDEVRRDPTPPPLNAQQQAAMLAAAAAAPPVSQVMPALPAARRPGWLPLALTAVATAALTLVLAYFLFGGGSDSDEPAPATVAASEASTPTPTPATAVTPPTPTPAPEPAAATADDDDGEGEGEDEGEDVGEDAEEPEVADGADDTAGAEAATEPPAAAETGDEDGDDDGDGDGDDDGDEDSETDTADLGAGACGLALTTRTDNARAYLDGRYLGTIPLEKQVPCDGKVLEVKHPRYDDYRRRIGLTEGSTKRMRVGLRRPTFQLRVVTYPSGATAYLGGRKIGRTPLTTKVSGFQRKTLKLVRDGYKPVRKRIYPKRKLTLVREKMQPGR